MRVSKVFASLACQIIHDPARLGGSAVSVLSVCIAISACILYMFPFWCQPMCALCEQSSTLHFDKAPHYIWIVEWSLQLHHCHLVVPWAVLLSLDRREWRLCPPSAIQPIWILPPVVLCLLPVASSLNQSTATCFSHCPSELICAHSLLLLSHVDSSMPWFTSIVMLWFSSTLMLYFHTHSITVSERTHSFKLPLSERTNSIIVSQNAEQSPLQLPTSKKFVNSFKKVCLFCGLFL